MVWLVTAGPDRRPQAVPVWFLWDGKSFLIYAQPGTKVRHIRANPQVQVHLNTDESGNEVVRASGAMSGGRMKSSVQSVATRILRSRPGSFMR